MIIKDYVHWKLRIHLSDPIPCHADVISRRSGVVAFSGLNQEEIEELRVALNEYETLLGSLPEFQPVSVQYHWPIGCAPPFQFQAVPKSQKSLWSKQEIEELAEKLSPFSKEEQKIVFTFVRHGETEWNRLKQHMALGHLDMSINETGENQAHKLKHVLEKFRFDAIVSSDLERAYATAKIVADPHNQEIILESRLRSRNWGELTGKVSALLFFENRKPELFKCVEASETIEARVFSFLEDYVKAASHSQRVLVVCHGSVMRVILAKILDFNLLGLKIQIKNTGFVRISYSQDRWKLEEMHDIELPTEIAFHRAGDSK